MSSGWLYPPFLWFLVAAFVVLLAAAWLMSALYRRGSAATGRGVLIAIWVAGSLGLAAVGFRQYGFWAGPPAAFSAGLSLLVVYAITARGAARPRPLAASARVSIAAVLATVCLPLSLLWLLAMLGIDGL
jgi:hypothetical protein